MTRALRSEGIGVVDLLPPLRASGQSAADLFYLQDKHLTAREMREALQDPQNFLDNQTRAQAETIIDKDLETEVIEPTQDWRAVEAEKTRQRQLETAEVRLTCSSTCLRTRTMPTAARRMISQQIIHLRYASYHLPCRYSL